MSAPAAAAVSIRAASVGYDGAAVVDAIDVHLDGGQLAVLMGTNGCGKSTLLKTLAGLIAPVGGEVRVLGAAPGTQPVEVAYLSQHPASSPTMPLSVADVVAMGRFARLGLLGRFGAADKAACAASMERMGITDLAGRSMMELSGGQRQRTFLAQALAREASLLLVDEPTAGLDPASRALFDTAIADERARGAAVVMATHDLSDAESADLAVLLAHRVIAAGPPAEVLTDANLRDCYGFTEQH
ncbi:MAG: metal ABC transporter ATP-binding protein [Actinobacteria bacterium]|jgi:ABC-type Mn2+/Zn2+ transport system ATPase subunit|nr:metal ABC transporter ATP-binding protein [Actinomycetota bacterium]